MTRLVIQIPCWNERDTLPATLADLPREIAGVDEVLWLVIDDGGVDGTAEVALQHGVDHVVRLPRHEGLARAFTAGIEAGLALGADFIVNTDADNQYCGQDVAKILAPALAGEADLVVGARPIWQTAHFSIVKKLLQVIGSRVVSALVGAPVRDAPSGFRAFSREVALSLNVFGEFSYTLETLIQSGQRGFRIVSVPIRTNFVKRPSRLFRSMPQYVLRSAITMIRSYTRYRPIRVLTALFGIELAFSAIAIGVAQAMRVDPAWATSAILATGLPALLIAAGIIADLNVANRKLLERLHRDGRANAASAQAGAPLPLRQTPPRRIA